jgi:hypothetical protein
MNQSNKDVFNFIDTYNDYNNATESKRAEKLLNLLELTYKCMGHKAMVNVIDKEIIDDTFKKTMLTGIIVARCNRK